MAPGANSIDSTDSSTTPRNASDTDMASSSIRRTVIDTVPVCQITNTHARQGSNYKPRPMPSQIRCKMSSNSGSLRYFRVLRVSGQDTVPPAMVDLAGYADDGPEYKPREQVSASSSARSESSSPESPRQADPRQDARDRRPQAREHHITGEDAMRLANEANRAIGAMPDQLALESRHKRYPRP